MNVRFTYALAVAWAFGLAMARPAQAQLIPATPDNTRARVKVGPLWMNPSVSLSDVGLDTNIFYDPETQDPKQDVAFTFVPQTDLWMRMGRTWLSGNIRQDLIWFRDYANERAANGSYRAGWIVPLTRMSLVVDGSWLRAKERSGFEIDARELRHEWMGSAALELRLLSRTFLGGRLERRGLGFDKASFYEGANLRRELNRTRTTALVGARHELTPLTSITAELSRFDDRFAFSPDRDAHSMQVAGGVILDPAALIKGTAQLGYRRFRPHDSSVPDYQGMTFAGTLSYEMRESTRISVDGLRDVEYSFDSSTQPYYVISGAAATVSQRIAGPFDAQGRAGYRRLAYRNSALETVVVAVRRDHVMTIGGGLGYRVGRDIRVSLDVEHQERTSDLNDRTYRGLRYGMSLSYGL